LIDSFFDPGSGACVGRAVCKLQAALATGRHDEIKLHTGDYDMKSLFALPIRLPLMAGALALTLAGCGSMDRQADRSATAGYAGASSTAGIPPTIDPFSSSYIPFPNSAQERSSTFGRSFYCEAHYSQPGCQSGQAPEMQGRRTGRY
jgi:hypothetical protein